MYTLSPQNPEEMVDVQISVRDIIDPSVIQVMKKIPRDRFVLEKHRDLAYSDQALPIGKSQTISQPYVVAFMTQALDLKSSSRVLEIGSGSGYQTAVLASIAQSVYSIEVIQSLLDRARSVLSSLNFTNIHTKCSDGRQGWKEHAPFDRIIVTAASEDIPPALLDQLANNGKMIIPIGRQHWSQDLVLISKQGKRIIKEKLLPVRFVPLVKKTSEKI
ncbi:MAG: protein-L-isoaspartate(D-aspartate) O-methyltransferase [Candidatus Marinimicrobia bacterium]|nr:protein-L-isoaspartate(D-aspartate) O-methyltransferase [Candidatus Neomarinimicrobiota bacterium]